MAGALHTAEHVQRPVLRGPRLIPERLERDANLDFVTGVCHAPLRIEDEILAEIRGLAASREPAESARAPLHTAGAFRERAVELHAERIDAEQQRLPAIVECAEVNL